MNSSDTGGESRASLLPSENYDAEVVVAAASDYEERTHVIYGKENVVKWALRLLSSANITLDLCGDRYGPSIIVANEQVMQKYIELYKRGVSQRHIIENRRRAFGYQRYLAKYERVNRPKQSRDTAG